MEFCPHVSYEDVFICANYELLSGDRGKVGKLYAMSIERGSALVRTAPVAASEAMSQVLVPSAVYARESSTPESLDSSAEKTGPETGSLSSSEGPTSRFNKSSSAPYQPFIHPHAVVNTPAVLDVKWSFTAPKTHPSSASPQRLVLECPIFGSALEDGTVRIYNVNRTASPTSPSLISQTSTSAAGRDSTSNNSSEAKHGDIAQAASAAALSIAEVARIQIGHSPSAICLSLDWNDRRSCPDTKSPEVDKRNNDDDDVDDDDDDDDESGEAKDDTEHTLPGSEMVVSLSDGSVAIVAVSNATRANETDNASRSSSDNNNNNSSSTRSNSNPLSLRLSSRWQAHDMEAWIAAFDYWDLNRVYTGSDDTHFKLWDRRMLPVIAEDDDAAAGFASAEDAAEYQVPRAVAVMTSREHSQGVCSVHCHPHNEHLVASGSYDEYMRVWDKRAMKTPLLKHHVGGGVWRLKWHPRPEHSSMILVAGMHNGVHVIDTGLFASQASAVDSHVSASSSSAAVTLMLAESDRRSLSTVAEYHRHGPTTLAYGADWSWANTASYFSHVRDADAGNFDKLRSSTVVGSCSFYNKRVDIWLPSSLS